MIHLFDKVYVDTDTNINLNTDRVVISKSVGYPTISLLEMLHPGTLIAYGQEYDDVINLNGEYTTLLGLLYHIKTNYSNKKVIIYADKESFIQILINWYSLIFNTVDTNTLYTVYQTYVFKHEALNSSRFEMGHGSKLHVYSQQDFNEAITFVEQHDINTKYAFVQSIANSLSVELLLATFLVSGAYKEELKSRVKILALVDLEKYMYEIKEMLVLQILHPLLQPKLGLTTPITIANINDLFSSTNRLIEVFFRSSIWKFQGLASPSSTGTILFENMSETDIQTVEEFVDICGSVWEEEYFYRYTQSDRGKFRFLPSLIKMQMSDDELNAIIDFEKQGSHAAGILNSPETNVNKYLLDHILNCLRTDNISTLNNISLVHA